MVVVSSLHLRPVLPYLTALLLGPSEYLATSSHFLSPWIPHV
jgi:hypothetical protein